ncbi:MAG: response regulator [Spirochaetes bacterium]|nr:response regulator [Spirochaetota bacterium]
MDTKTILVVEDEPLLALELCEDLTKHGYKVPPSINDGDMVLAGVLRHKPDLVVMNIKLFGFRSGLDEALRIRGFFKTPIVYLSSYPYTEVAEQVKRTGPAAYLEKPYNEASLLETIGRMLGTQ